jgi:hypothetical protein
VNKRIYALAHECAQILRQNCSDRDRRCPRHTPEAFARAARTEVILAEVKQLLALVPALHAAAQAAWDSGDHRYFTEYCRVAAEGDQTTAALHAALERWNSGERPGGPKPEMPPSPIDQRLALLEQQLQQFDLPDPTEEPFDSNAEERAALFRDILHRLEFADPFPELQGAEYVMEFVAWLARVQAYREGARLTGDA